MFEIKKTISLRYILETVCEDVMDREYGKTFSLEEKLAFVNENLPYVRVNGSVMILKQCMRLKQNVFEVPFFNYLLVSRKYIVSYNHQGIRRSDDTIYIIHGFNTFAELEKYVSPKRNIYIHCIYVRCENRYEKAVPVFSYQSPGKERNYVDQYGFYIMNYPHVGFYRDPNSEYYFEIYGLCEVHRMNEVRCSIVSSLEALNLYLSHIAEDIEINCFDRGVEEYKENGKVYYNGEIYTYEISAGKKELGGSIYNKNGEFYCSHKYGFCGLPPEACEDNSNCFPDLPPGFFSF